MVGTNVFFAHPAILICQQKKNFLFFTREHFYGLILIDSIKFMYYTFLLRAICES